VIKFTVQVGRGVSRV